MGIFKLPRITTTDRSTLTLGLGELVYDTDLDQVFQGDGATAGGNAIASGTGDVVGPASAVNNRVVFFDGSTGKLIKDSGLTLSGSNTGDQTITLTGDVTGSGSGSFAATIANSAVTLAKMANVATASVFYRKTSGTGAPEVQTLATLKTDLGLTGTNSGDQTITLTGDVTGSGTNSFAATISNNSVTLAKMDTMATASFLGRNTAGTGNVEVLSVATVSSMLSLSGTNSGDETTSSIKTKLGAATTSTDGYLTSTDWNTFNGKQAALSGSGIVKSTGGTISYLTDNSSNWDTAYTNRITSLTTTGSSGAATLVSNVLNIPNYTLAGLGGQPLATNLTSLAGLSYSSASFVKMTASGTFSLDTATYLTSNQTITLSGDVSGSGTTAITTTIGANKVTNSMLAQVATAIFKGRNTAGTGNVEDLTATQATALLDTFTSSLKGLTPASGGGTTNFLRADGTWAAPSGGGGGTPGGSDTQIQYNSAGAFAGSANLVWDNTNTRLGIAQSTPTSRFHLNFNQNSVTQADANGILLANSTAATVGLQSISPPIVLQGNGWKTAATAGSQDVRFRMDVLPVQGTTSPTGQFRLALSVAGGAYTNLFTIDNSISASAGLLTTNFISTGGWITSGTVIGASSQIMGGSTNGSSGGVTYKLTNAGGSVTPKGSFGAINVVTAGTIGLQLDNTNHLIFTAGNGSAHIARAAIQILSLTNTAGSETGDLAFLTQTGGTAIAERMRIFAAGNVGIGTGSSNAGYKLDVNGSGRFSSALTTTGRIQAYSRKTSNYTLVNTDKVIGGDAGTAVITITLPAHVAGTEYTIVKVDSSGNKVTIATTSGTISGAASYDLTAQYMFITVISDGTNWLIISS